MLDVYDTLYFALILATTADKVEAVRGQIIEAYKKGQLRTAEFRMLDRAADSMVA